MSKNIISQKHHLSKILDVSCIYEKTTKINLLVLNLYMKIISKLICKILVDGWIFNLQMPGIKTIQKSIHKILLE